MFDAFIEVVHHASLMVTGPCLGGLTICGLAHMCIDSSTEQAPCYAGNTCV